MEKQPQTILVPIKLYLQKEARSWICPMGCNVLTHEIDGLLDESMSASLEMQGTD